MSPLNNIGKVNKEEKDFQNNSSNGAAKLKSQNKILSFSCKK